MDSFNDTQIEELTNFDYIADEDYLDEIVNDEFNLNEYLNGNYDY
jgi:hypothetical protein